MSFIADPVAVAKTMLQGPLPTALPEWCLNQETVVEKLLVAEADASRRLRVLFEPTMMLPFPVTQDDIDSVPIGMPWMEEPGYDYEPDLFYGDGWGYLVSRQKPIVQVDFLKFTYPLPEDEVWNIPLEWIRLDKKYGHIRIVPAATAFGAPFSAWMLQVLGGGKTIPQMIRIRYVAGLTDAATQFPDLLDVIKRMAILTLVEDAFPETSGSINVDGLSQSKGIDLSTYRLAIEDRLVALYDALHGVRCIVV